MRVLHIAAHLGGGVGKAHAAMRAADSHSMDHRYFLLEKARDRRYLEAVEASGATVIEIPDKASLYDEIRAADIVQIEFWNHPRLYEFLAGKDLPPARYLFWSHISGLAPPLIPSGPMEEAAAFVFTSPISMRHNHEGNLHVIGSGFGFERLPQKREPGGKVRVGYLGTVDFVKMHPAFFDMIDMVESDAFEVLIYGAFGPDDAPAKAHRVMQHPERVRFMGTTDDPAEALSALDIFFYPLARGHFGTAENALVEAMSVGAVPLVLDNLAECAIVRDGVTGLIAGETDCAQKLQNLIEDQSLGEGLSVAAMSYAREHFRADQSVAAFGVLYRDLVTRPKQQPAFWKAIGETPLAWYLSSFPDGEPQGVEKPSKGSLTHFLNYYPEDKALNDRAATANQLDRHQE